MKLDLLSVLGTSYAQDKQLIKKIMSNPSAFVAWVDSFNSEKGTINVQPAMQTQIIDKNNVSSYANKPFLTNVWVVANTLDRNPQKGDKALILVLDEKSNTFFKTNFDSNIPPQDQTFVSSSNAKKDISNAVAIIINANAQPTQTPQMYQHNIHYNNLEKESEDITLRIDMCCTIISTKSTPYTYAEFIEYLQNYDKDLGYSSWLPATGYVYNTSNSQLYSLIYGVGKSLVGGVINSFIPTADISIADGKYTYFFPDTLETASSFNDRVF